MRKAFTITFLLAFGVVSAQQKAVKDTLVYKYEPRYCNVALWLPSAKKGQHPR